MRTGRLLAAGTAALVLNLPQTAAAQRVIDLTGRPAASLDEEFTAITGFSEIGPGRAVISDMMEDRLVLADMTGNRVTAIGRKGNGPGEWSLPYSVIPGPRAGQVYVHDPINRQSHIVDANGKIIESVPLLGTESSAGGRITSIGARMRSDARGRVYREAPPAIGPGSSTIDSLPLLRWDPASRETDTITWIPTRINTSVTSGPAGSGSGSRTITSTIGGSERPFAPATAWEVFPDGRVAIVRSEPYRVDIVGTDGRLQRGTPIRYTPVRVTREDREAYRESRRNSRGRVFTTGGGGGTATAPTAPATAREIPDNLFPDTKPPIAGGLESVKMSPAGEIWVNRSRAHDDDTPRYDVIDGSGRVVAEARLRPNSVVVGFGADRAVYVARTDPETDIRYLEMYRLP